jgi:hypothetical protein
MARDLVRNGFVPLTQENARLYARGLGVAEADADAVAANLFTGKKSVVVEQVGMGNKTAFKLGAGGPDILDRSELIRFLKEEHIPNVKKAGDPYKLLPQLQQLVEKLEPEKASLASVHPPATAVSGEVSQSKSPPLKPSRTTQLPSLAPSYPPAKSVSGEIDREGSPAPKLTGDPTSAPTGLRFRVRSVGMAGLQVGVGAGIGVPS